MRLGFENERVLAVVAHPDDAELLCAGTLSRARKGGAAIAMCVLCQGNKGQPGKKVDHLAAVRRREMTASAKLLASELFLLGQPDGTLKDVPEVRLKLVEVYRRFTPTLVLAHAPEDYHPDHRGASALAEAASWFCASRGHRTSSPAMEAPPGLWWMDTLAMSGFNPQFYVDISEFAGLKTKCLRVTGANSRVVNTDFSPLPELMRLQCQARGLQAGVEAAEAFCAHNVFKRARAW
jgi:LmbE family N-acetylglucosaminyl deacetylase